MYVWQTVFQRCDGKPRKSRSAPARLPPDSIRTAHIAPNPRGPAQFSSPPAADHGSDTGCKRSLQCQPATGMTDIAKSQCPSAADAKISRQAVATAIHESKNQWTVIPSQPLGVRNRNCPNENASVTPA